MYKVLVYIIIWSWWYLKKTKKQTNKTTTRMTVICIDMFCKSGKETYFSIVHDCDLEHTCLFQGYTERPPILD